MFQLGGTVFYVKFPFPNESSQTSAKFTCEFPFVDVFFPDFDSGGEKSS